MPILAVYMLDLERKDNNMKSVRYRPLIIIAAFVILLTSTAIWAQESPDGHTVSINDFEMYYEICGEGTPLVLLHGFMSSGVVWESYIKDLSEHYRLIIPDLRGHGASTNPVNQFTHKQSALDIFALLDELQINQFKAMGISTGGMTLIHMATQQPDRVEAMVLIGASIYFPEQGRAVMRQFLPDSISEDRWNVLRERHKHGDNQIYTLLTQFHNFKDSYDDMNFTPPYLSIIKARTLIVHGDRDHLFPVSIPVEMYRCIPKSYLWIIPNGGHVPIGGENRKPFINKALDFLNEEWEKD